MTTIHCVGELLVDMIGEGETSLKNAPRFEKKPGGAPANVAVAASRLGAEVRMTATVGDDEFGDFLIEKLRDESVDTCDTRRSSENTTLAFASADTDGDPRFSFYRGADERITAEQLSIDTDVDVLHLGSLPLTNPDTASNIISAMEASDADVSFDPNLRSELLTPDYVERLRDVVRHTDVLLASEDEVEFLGGVEQLVERVGEVVVSKGSRGARLVTRDRTLEHDAPDVDVKDTTGAGDALAGAYLTYRSEGMEKALRNAVEAASISVTSEGAMSALPTSYEMEKVGLSVD